MEGHALVVGGTGMLAGVSVALAREGRTVTVIARDRGRLSRLQSSAAGVTGAIRPLPLDYRDTAGLAAALARSQERDGPFGLAVCWMHDTAPAGPAAVADAIGTGTHLCRFFHLLGSASRQPLEEAPRWAAALRARPRIAYCQVILGFVTDGSRSRWLTNQEITRGVTTAIALDARRHIVGTIAPWEARP